MVYVVSSFLKKEILILFLIILLLIPTFKTMLKPGIFTMHDFHVFRLYEYDKCISDLQIPCRWVPDAAFSYGQPLFNFYGQGSYIFGEFFRLLGFSVLDSIKALFILSIIFSAISMFILSKQLWVDNKAAIFSSIIYSYAPYRAVDIYVRGALPEALSFTFFPLLTYFFNSYILRRKTTALLTFSALFAGLVLTHNLSALMYCIFLLFWGSFFIYKHNAWNEIPKFILAGLLSFVISAFYILPVIFENKFITLAKTTQGYYSFENHFVSLKQLFISRYWGYGGSLWGEDDRLSLSVGHGQWLIPLLILVFIIAFKKIKVFKNFFIFLMIGYFMLFLTHLKSRLIWVSVPVISFVQFPWRFLGPAVFCFSVASGAGIKIVKNKYFEWTIFLVGGAITIIINAPFFKEDLWLNFSDSQFFSGTHFDDQTASAIHDFWPKYGQETPVKPASLDPKFIEGLGSAKLLVKKSNRAEYDLNITSDKATVEIPIVYFPGWEGYSHRKLGLYPGGRYGLITTEVNSNDRKITLEFKDTPIRTVANIISIMGILFLAFLYFKSFKLFNK